MLGQTAKVRAIEILGNMGCDIRILEVDEGCKDPDEYIVKYGNARFLNIVDKAISVVEFKVKILRQKLDLENVNDKIKFLNEIANIMAKITNNMEMEVYIEKIAKTYDISKEAIYSEVNKLKYFKIKEEKPNVNVKPVIRKLEQFENESMVTEAIKKRENTIISILLSGDLDVFNVIKQSLNANDFKYEIDKKIIKKLYEEFEKGNSSINSMINTMDELEQSHITKIMAEDYEIDENNIEKAINDIFKIYEIEKLNNRKIQILNILEENRNNNIEENNINTKELEKELSDIIINLAKIK